MRAVCSSFLPTYSSTTMRLYIPLILWILILPTVAVVLGHGFGVFALAEWTTPIEDELGWPNLVLVDIVDPLFDACEMHGCATQPARPYPVLFVDGL